MVIRMLLAMALTLSLGCAEWFSPPMGTPSGEVPRPEQQPPSNPQQKKYPAPVPESMQVEGVDIAVNLHAKYRIDARVLSTERYYSGLRADISPVDFGLGWGPIADPAVDEYVDWSQGGRWMTYWCEHNDLVNRAVITLNSANTHIIPATGNLRRALLRVDEGDVVRMEGSLVYLRWTEDGRAQWWNSSLSRKDDGDGACEVFRVERLVWAGQEFR